MTATPSLLITEESRPNLELLARYKSVLSFIERLHRLLLDVIKDELERLKVNDVTGAQALLMFNVSSKKVTIGELKARGYYLGSNASYTLKKLADGGYVVNERCSVDRRVTRIKLTEKGVATANIVTSLLDRHAGIFTEQGPLAVEEFDNMAGSMKSLELFWSERIRYVY